MRRCENESNMQRREGESEEHRQQRLAQQMFLDMQRREGESEEHRQHRLTQQQESNVEEHNSTACSTDDRYAEKGGGV